MNIKLATMDGDNENDGNYDDEETKTFGSHGTKKSNILPLWGNERTMNLNNLILTNIQSSHYFKVNLYELKTYHEVIDEIYYKVSHLEPWEKGSRKTAGQTGMCGGVRGVGAGGIVSTAYCLLYKLFTLKLTRKQVNGLITHPDSPYIRALGFMYIRYTQPPADLWDWYDEYLEDPEEMDVKAGGGQVMTIGNILKNFLCKLEWFSTLFPRIPVPIQQKLEKMMNERFPPPVVAGTAAGAAVAAARKPLATGGGAGRHIPDGEAHFGQAERVARSRGEPDSEKRGYSRENDERRIVNQHDDRRGYSRDRDRESERRTVNQHDDRRGYSRDRDRESERRTVNQHDDRRGYSRDRDRESERRIVNQHDDRRGYSRDRDRESERRGTSRDGDRERGRERDTSRRSSRDRGYSPSREKERLRLERERERDRRDRDRDDRDKRDRGRKDSPVRRRDDDRFRRDSPRKRDDFDDRRRDRDDPDDRRRDRDRDRERPRRR